MIGTDNIYLLRLYILNCISKHQAEWSNGHALSLLHQIVSAGGSNPTNVLLSAFLLVHTNTDAVEMSELEASTCGARVRECHFLTGCTYL